MKGLAITETELERVANISTSHNYAFVGMAFGAFANAMVTLISTDLSGRPYEILLSTAIATALFSLCFGYMAVRDYQRSNNELTKLKAQMEEFVLHQSR